MPITYTQDTRRTFIDELIKLARKDPKIVLIVPDVGFNYIEEFQREFPDRFFNFGVTEQSTVLIAAAMALDGLKPYVYSMINFVLFRPYEMVRNGIGYHQANVKLIGVKGSEKYKFLGFSHNIEHGEDAKVVANIPHLEYQVADSNPAVKRIIKSTYEREVAAYIRI